MSPSTPEPTLKQKSDLSRDRGRGKERTSKILLTLFVIAMFVTVLFGLDIFQQLANASARNSVEEENSFGIREALAIHKNADLENDEPLIDSHELFGADKGPQPNSNPPSSFFSSTKQGQKNESNNQGVAQSDQRSKASTHSNNRPPICRVKGEERLRMLPACMMPALNTRRPKAYDLWREKLFKKKREWELEKSQKGPPPTFPLEAPPHLLRPPLGLTYFRPPRYGQKDLTFNGSMPVESFFVPYDEKEWDSYCEAVMEDSKENGASTGVTIVVPDKFVIGYIHDQGAWEEETITGQLTPSLFRMDRSRATSRRKHRWKNATDAERSNDYYISSSASESEKSSFLREIVGEDTNNFNLHPTIFALLLRYDALLKDPANIVADFATTINCFSQHLAMWYEPSVIDSVFLNHRRTSSFFMVNDRLFSISDLKIGLGHYEMVRYGEWGVQPAEQLPDRQLVQIDERNKSRLYFVSDEHDTNSDSNNEHRNGSKSTDRRVIVGRDNFQRLRPFRNFMAFDIESNRALAKEKKPFVLPEIRTIFSTSDEYAEHPDHAKLFADWVWGGIEAPSEAERAVSEHLQGLEEQRRSKGKVYSPLQLQKAKYSPTSAFLPLPKTGRTYLRQYGYLPLNTFFPQNQLTFRQQRSINQVMLSFRKYRRGVMTMKRVLANGKGKVGYWGGAEDISLKRKADERGSKHIAAPDNASNYSLLERDYLWTFFGELKRDRSNLNATLTSIASHMNEKYLCCSGEDIEAFYGNSMFVPVGRGYIILDCSRLYEGSAAGAIPVIVTKDMNELVAYFGTFSGGGPYAHPKDWTGYKPEKHNMTQADLEKLARLPPFAYAGSWADAAMLLYSLRHSPQVLEAKRRKVALWFMNHYAFVQEALVFGTEDGGIEEGKPIATDFDIRPKKKK